jgi:hypothetical protein
LQRFDPFLAYVYALAGTWLVVPASFLLAAHHGPTFIAVRALAFGVYAALFGAFPLGLGSIVLVAFAWVIGHANLPSDPSALSVAGCLVAVMLTALLSERRYVGERPGLIHHQRPATAYLLYGAAAWLLARYISERMSHLPAAQILAGVAVALGALMLLLNPRALCLCATGMFLWAAACWNAEPYFLHPTAWHATVALLAVAGLAGDRYFHLRRPFTLPAPGVVLVAAVWGMLEDYVVLATAPAWHAFWWAALAFGFLGYGLGFRSKTAGVLSLATAVQVTASLLYTAYLEHLPVWPLIAGFSAIILFWILWERLYTFAAAHFSLPIPKAALAYLRGVFVALPSVLLILLLERIPLLHDYYLTISWTGAALALFALSFVARQEFYRYAGLATFVLALGRVAVIDTQRLQGAYRIAAWIVLGVVLLVVGYVYVWAREHRKGKPGDPAGPQAPQGT